MLLFRFRRRSIPTSISSSISLEYRGMTPESGHGLTGYYMVTSIKDFLFFIFYFYHTVAAKAIITHYPLCFIMSYLHLLLLRKK